MPSAAFSKRHLIKEIFLCTIMGALILFNSSCLKDIIPEPTIADFSYSGQLITGNSISFTSNSTNATSYSWDFADGYSPNNNTSTAANPQHIFIMPGDYTVTLTATGKGGANSISKTLLPMIH